MHQSAELSLLLNDARRGDTSAMDKVVAAVYDELRVIARRHRARERLNHSLDTTGIVHEAYFKLAGLDKIEWKNRAHFFAIAARIMRQLLIDHARKRRAEKRGGDAAVLSLDATEFEGLEGLISVPDNRVDELIGLDSALQRLEAMNERHARVVECRFFTGLSIEETAKAIGVSPATVKREWVLARAWLNRELRSEGTDE